MTKNNPFRLNPEVSTTLPRFLAHAEGTTGETGKTSIVRNGDSGLSVGRIQMDLSEHKDLADRLVAIGKANGVAGAEEITADKLKQTHGAFKDKGGKDEKGTKVQLKQELTPESFRSDDRDTTLYAQKNPVPIATRDINVDAANARFPIQTPQSEKRSDAEDDGDLGPQTRAGFGRALEKVGPDGFARTFALGQFRDYATRLDNGVERYENLAGAVEGSLGRVDRNAAANFQDYLNVARDNLPPHVRYAGLKRDGWIGPKTTDAFKTALYNRGTKNIADDLEGLFGV